MLKASTDNFNRLQHRYKIELFSSNYRNYADWVKSVALTGGLPCLLEVDGPYVADFAWPGYLQPLDKFVSRDLRNDLLPSIIAQGTYDGRLYTLGQFDSGLGLWANKRYLEMAGVRIPTVDAPWSLSEFEHILVKLSSVKGVDYPLSMTVYAGMSEFYAYAYSPILQGFGGDLIDRKSYRTAHGVLDGPQSIAAMKRFQYWFKQGWTQPIFKRNDDFEKRRTALSWTGHWKYPGYRKALGDDLILLPLPDFGHGIKTGMGSLSWAITSTCDAPEGAWAFLAYLMTPQEVLRMTNANGAVPARKSALAESPLYGRDAPLNVYAQQLLHGHGVPRPAVPGYSTISKSFSKAMSDIIAGNNVEAALGKAADDIDADIIARDPNSQSRQ
ncbi:extracellular solute-binding protein [Novimethylophilus kurashikiensis]|uniref:extracellular solute-binding protein n=1 Tax=Novimethylophilus kurashikiensis TaxID=1825523 RepID=UPI0015E80FDC|nr:extracellular solute-binding protein [Novimethylophilus kurashikiensis]